jgi:hypothetical protein
LDRAALLAKTSAAWIASRQGSALVARRWRREAIKASGKVQDAGPLFAGLATCRRLPSVSKLECWPLMILTSPPG